MTKEVAKSQVASKTTFELLQEIFEQPHTMCELMRRYAMPTVKEAVKRTRRTDKEHAFYLCSDRTGRSGFRATNIVEGERTHVHTFDAARECLDSGDSPLIEAHTHPRWSPAFPSAPDIKFPTAMCIISSFPGQNTATMRCIRIVSEEDKDCFFAYARLKQEAEKLGAETDDAYRRRRWAEIDGDPPDVVAAARAAETEIWAKAEALFGEATKKRDECMVARTCAVTLKVGGASDP